jgi:putative phosphoesterase
MPTFDLPIDTRIPVISDTHGLLRPEAVALLTGAPLILHVGDVDRPAILEELNEIATTVVVRGNVDRGDFGDSLPLTKVVDISGRLIYMRHIIQDIDIDPATAGFQIVLSGHSHHPGIETRSDVTYLNPGSIGPRRFTLPVSMAWLTITDTGFLPELIELTV